MKTPQYIKNWWVNNESSFQYNRALEENLIGRNGEIHLTAWEQEGEKGEWLSVQVFLDSSYLKASAS